LLLFFFLLRSSSLTHFEDLSNEVIYEIFDFFDICHIYQAFFHVNKRFEKLLIDSTFPIKINISSMSKLDFQRYYSNIIIPNKYRIISLVYQIYLLSIIFYHQYILLQHLVDFKYLFLIILKLNILKIFSIMHYLYLNFIH